jgi:DNA-binding MarR family transcriptional regulator
MSQKNSAIDDWQAGLTALLESRGKTAPAVKALVDFEAAMFRFHRRVAKGELIALALRRLELRIEPAQFQALTAVARIQHGVGRDAPVAPTIGLIAEEMSLDPSRASRIVADLVRSGHVQRGAAQDDGRKSVIKLTELGGSVLYAMRDARWNLLLEVFASWSESDLQSLSQGLTRYLDDSEAFMSGTAATDGK